MSSFSPLPEKMCDKYDTFYVLIICLKVIKLTIADGYSYPQPPFQFEEPATPPSPIYLPPPLFPEDVPQVPTYLPPVYPPVSNPPIQDEILPPYDDGIIIPAPPSNQYLPPTSKQTPLQVLNMSCLDSRDGGGYFKSFFRTSTQSRGFPVMESTSSECAITPFGNDGYRIELEGQKMLDCGIRSCGVRMCLILRMATVPGLRLAEDSLVTLQCIPQETVVSHTKHLRLNGQLSQARANLRSIPIASGGNQRKFESVVTLLRKNNGVFDQPIQQGSAVRLGDELLLRATVKDGDGWKSGRMGMVIIRSSSSQRSVVLVDENGCRNPTIRTICPQQPQQVSPLTVQFPFRAFLFQGAAPADDLLLSVRMSACLRPRDCYQSKICEDNARSRATRAANFSEDLITDWESQFQFRVLPIDVPNEKPKNSNWVVVGLGIVAIILGCSVVGLMVRPIKERIYL